MNIMTPKEHELIINANVEILINDVKKPIYDAMSKGDFECHCKINDVVKKHIFDRFQQTLYKEFNTRGWELEIREEHNLGQTVTYLFLSWKSALEKDKFDDYCETNYGTKLS